MIESLRIFFLKPHKSTSVINICFWAFLSSKSPQDSPVKFKILNDTCSTKSPKFFQSSPPNQCGSVHQNNTPHFLVIHCCFILLFSAWKKDGQCPALEEKELFQYINYISSPIETKTGTQKEHTEAHFPLCESRKVPCAHRALENNNAKHAGATPQRRNSLFSMQKDRNGWC